jgi:putative transposase
MTRGALPPRAARREVLVAEGARLFARAPDAGWKASENTVAQRMAEQHLAARRKKKRMATTRPGRGRWRAPDLVKRDFGAGKISQKWFGDGTKIVVGQGRLYLASVLDTGSRRILGFALSRSLPETS